MTRKVNTIAMVVLSIAINCSLTQGQTPPSTTLVIDLQNVVEYQDDAGNPAKFATDPNPAPSATCINLGVGTVIEDIVAVNGKPAKGIYRGCHPSGRRVDCEQSGQRLQSNEPFTNH